MARANEPVLFLTGLRGYRRRWLGRDLVAGVSVCMVMIPSVIAYAELVGLPPVHGLYGALAAMVGYAIFASSRQVIAGPDAAIALLAAAAIGPMAAGDPARAAALAAVLALLGGALMLLAAVLRAGVVADFFSKPVLVGYMTGAALVLISTQLGRLFGLDVEAREFFRVMAELARRLGETHRLTLALGLGAVAVLAVLHRLAPRAPGALAVFILGLLASAVYDLEGRGVQLLGAVAGGLPRPAIPAVTLEDVQDLLPAATGIALLTFPEGVLLARAFAAKNRYDVRPNQELVALAAANVAAGLFQGFSSGASQSRTTVNDATGGRTQVVSLAAAGALALFMLFLTPLLARLPSVVLGAILVFGGAHLIDLRGLRALFRLSRGAFWVAIVVTAGVLVVGVVPGILIGVMISLIILLARLARPLDAVLQRLSGTDRFHDLGEDGAFQTVPGVIAYRFYAPLFFPNAQHFMDRVRALLDEAPDPVRWFVLDAQAIWDIDVTAAEALDRLCEDLARRGIALKIARANRPLRAKLERIGLSDRIGPEAFFPSVHRAIETFQAGPTAGPAAEGPP
jgi:SulP family sulfate permease